LLPLRGWVDPVQFPLGDCLFEPGDETAVVVVRTGVPQVGEVQGPGAPDDVPEGIALDRVDIPICMLPKGLHKYPNKV